MLINRDAQARYVAATLAVLGSELHAVGLPAGARRSIFDLLQRAQERAEQLADHLYADAMTPKPCLVRAPASPETTSSRLYGVALSGFELKKFGWPGNLYGRLPSTLGWHSE